ncbi:MAG: DUF1045 domain-containing protein [Sulfitobacter sp.]
MFERYAVFYTPTGAFADWGAAWLGWDSAGGCHVPQPQLADIDVPRITATPRKYGLHGTLKAPFHLSEGRSEAELHKAAQHFAAHHPPATIDALALRHTSGFIALRPTSDAQSLSVLAEQVVRDFDAFRSPLKDEDIARRRKSRLSPRQDAQLLRWGYPYVFEDFHFHLTLSGRMPAPQAAVLIDTLTPQIDTMLPVPFVVEAITLMGQDSGGMFHQIARYLLTGSQSV